jgi:hypothetical protein
MKKIFTLMISMALLVLSSCSLDADLKSAITTNAAWESSSDAKAGMYGMLSRFRGAFTTDYIYWGEYRTGLWALALETSPRLQETRYMQMPSLQHTLRPTGQICIPLSMMPT